MIDNDVTQTMILLSLHHYTGVVYNDYMFGWRPLVQRRLTHDTVGFVVVNQVMSY